MKIKFLSVDDVATFVNQVSELSCDVNVMYGSQVYDGKSLVGLMNLDRSKIYEVYCVTDNEEEQRLFAKIINQYKEY